MPWPVLMIPSSTDARSAPSDKDPSSAVSGSASDVSLVSSSLVIGPGGGRSSVDVDEVGSDGGGP